MSRVLLIVYLALYFNAASAQMLEQCEAPSPTPFDPGSCVTPGIRSGSWNLQPLSAITAVGSFNGITMYETEPLPVSSVAAEIVFGDCTGPAELVIQSSGLKTPIRPETESEMLDGAHAIYEGDGRMDLGGGVGYNTSVEITAQDPQSAIMFFVLKDAPVGFGQGDITFEMLYAGPDEDDAHPYCDCRTQLRGFLDRRIARYERILAMYQDTDLWFSHKDLDPNIYYDYGTYNQFALMVHLRDLNAEQVSGCFNARLEEVGTAQSEGVAEFFEQEGRAAAETSPDTCLPTSHRNEKDSCYPEIDLVTHGRHEGVHEVDCRAARTAYTGTDAFSWLRDTVDFGESPTHRRENGMKAYLNPSVQALAETEIRAYQDTLAFYRGWEEANCTPS